jgi:hypothetical protein
MPHVPSIVLPEAGAANGRAHPNGGARAVERAEPARAASATAAAGAAGSGRDKVVPAVHPTAVRTDQHKPGTPSETASNETGSNETASNEPASGATANNTDSNPGNQADATSAGKASRTNATTPTGPDFSVSQLEVKLILAKRRIIGTLLRREKPVKTP